MWTQNDFYACFIFMPVLCRRIDGRLITVLHVLLAVAAAAPLRLFLWRGFSDAHFLPTADLGIVKRNT